MDFKYDLIEDIPDSKKKGIYYMQIILGLLILISGLIWLNKYYSRGHIWDLITGLICTIGGGLQAIFTYKNGLINKGDVYYQINGKTINYRLSKHSKEININLDEVKSIMIGADELILKRKNLDEIFLKTVFINKEKKSEFIRVIKQKIES